ncbi:MAG: alpha/beta hydrolase [Oscillospiraceae bacterium]|nr:alpha/beta hydrolase [Oscillospiraceae bacterium]
MPSFQYKMVSGLFRLIGVRKMLDKEGAEFEKLLEKYRKKQQKPLKVPYGKLKERFEIMQKTVGGVTCYILRQRDSAPKRAVLYLFGGGYILPPDPGDLVLCGQIAAACDAEVWFPLYPMAPAHRLVETLQSTLAVYREMLTRYEAQQIRFFGTSSGGGQALSLCVYIRHEQPAVPLPGRLVLQSPGLQVPPSPAQRAEMEKRRERDVMIPPRFFDQIAPVLATGDEAWLLSPLLCDLSGFPPIDLFYGTEEVMIAYLEDMRKVCRRFGVPLTVQIGEGMMHCWGAMEFVPEAKAVRQAYFKALCAEPRQGS